MFCISSSFIIARIAEINKNVPRNSAGSAANIVLLQCQCISFAATYPRTRDCGQMGRFSCRAGTGPSCANVLLSCGGPSLSAAVRHGWAALLQHSSSSPPRPRLTLASDRAELSLAVTGPSRRDRGDSDHAVTVTRAGRALAAEHCTARPGCQTGHRRGDAADRRLQSLAGPGRSDSGSGSEGLPGGTEHRDRDPAYGHRLSVWPAGGPTPGRPGGVSPAGSGLGDTGARRDRADS
jgi:hypothetical protein